jgi:hypothetical protein
MCGGLLLRRDRVAQRQNLCHDWLDFSRVDQVRNLREVCCTCAMRKSENRDAQKCEARMTHLHKLSRIERGPTTG